MCLLNLLIDKNKRPYHLTENPYIRLLEKVESDCYGIMGFNEKLATINAFDFGLPEILLDKVRADEDIRVRVYVAANCYSSNYDNKIENWFENDPEEVVRASLWRNSNNKYLNFNLPCSLDLDPNLLQKRFEKLPHSHMFAWMMLDYSGSWLSEVFKSLIDFEQKYINIDTKYKTDLIMTAMLNERLMASVFHFQSNIFEEFLFSDLKAGNVALACYAIDHVKQLSEKKRMELYSLLPENAKSYQLQKFKPTMNPIIEPVPNHDQKNDKWFKW